MLKTIQKLARFALADGGSITSRIVRSGVLVGLSEAMLQALTLARSIVLARLLAPEMFGLMGLAMIVVRAIETFTRPGIAQALIARQRNFAEARDTAFTLLVARGFLLAIALMIIAPMIATLYDEERLEAILLFLSLIFVIGGFANINIVARQRELDFRQLTYLNQATNIAGTIATVTVAFWTRDVWALVIGQIITATLNTTLSYVFLEGKIHFRLDRTIASELMSYGKFITGSSIVLFVAMEIDSAVIGKVLGTEQLGFYTLAFMIANLATANLSRVTSTIMMPAYSKLQSDLPALRRAYLRTLALVMFLVLPAACGLVVVAGPLLEVIYGAKWLPATAPLQILALFGLFRALASFSGYLFEGMGMPKIGLQLGIIRLVVVASLIMPMSVAFGLPGAAFTVTVGMAIQWLAGIFYLRTRLGVRVPDLLRAIWRPTWTAAAMASLVYFVQVSWNPGELLPLLGTVGLGAATYMLLNIPQLLELKTLWSRSDT